MSMPTTENESQIRELKLDVYGRMIEHLGFQMYQNPADAIGEYIANAWDADATKVNILIPETLDEDSEIVIIDDGDGMNFDECGQKFLGIGFASRGVKKKTAKGRKPIGKKGIGKFAGFGISRSIKVSTVKRDTGESIDFELNGDDLLSDEIKLHEYKIAATWVASTDPSKHGTTVRLKRLQTKQPDLNPQDIAKVISRKFSLLSYKQDFTISINGKELQGNPDAPGEIEFDFPNDYQKLKGLTLPTGLTIDEDGWGVEKLPNGENIRWRIKFCRETISDKDVTGVSVFCRGKMAQAPFLFALTGGFPSQNAPTYMWGQVEADYLDDLDADLIATDRQSINWGHKDAYFLLEWGRSKLKELMRVWKQQRALKKIEKIEAKAGKMDDRLKAYQPEERKTVENVIKKLAEVEALDEQKFEDVSDAVIRCWDAGRLRGLISRIASEDMGSEQMVSILTEANSLIQLGIGETVRVKWEAVQKLEEHVRQKTIENDVRDFIAERPWLISSDWETFKRERQVEKFCTDIRKEKVESDVRWSADETLKKRIDLVLRNGNRLLVIEFMRPGITVDRDHARRFEDYIDAVKAALRENTATYGEFNPDQVVGYLVASNLSVDPIMAEKFRGMKEQGKFVLDWSMLLLKAKEQFKEYMDLLLERDPENKRLQSIISDSPNDLNPSAPSSGEQESLKLS